MPWNEADRERYNIVRERYTSDLSDEEYALIEPLLPQPKRRGRKPTPARTILNAIFYLARCACPWRYVVVVKRTDKKIKGFVVLPKRWIAERTLGWINRSRRLAKDFEGTIESALAWMQIAFIAILLRRLAYDGS
jgi:transposase